jgi:hypothetical protein
MVMGALPVAVLGAAGFDRIASRLSPSTRRIFAFAVGAALVIEFAAIPLHEYPFTVTIPAADRWVAQQRKPFVVAEVPVTVERYQTIYMLHSTAHWQRTVAGYGGIRPVLSQEINGVLQGFPDATGIRYLAELGVTYVIVHIDMYPPGEWPIAQERLRAFEGSGLRLEYADDNARVYSLSQRDVASPR